MTAHGKPKKFRRWSQVDRATICRMRKAGATNGEIAEHFQVPRRTIDMQFNWMRKRGMDVAESENKPGPKPALRRAPPVPTGPTLVELPGLPPREPLPAPDRRACGTSRAVRTSALVTDAELRSRIAEQGLTAGLLGDPPRGRSALDQKRLVGGARS